MMNNASWRVILDLLSPAGLVDPATLDRATTQFGGAHVTAAEAVAIANFVDREVLDEQRVSDADMRDLLARLAEFARASEGFRVMQPRTDPSLPFVAAALLGGWRYQRWPLAPSRLHRLQRRMRH